jgi:dynein heavy chain
MRIQDINFKSTKDFYDFTCRSLFERDKLLFSFCLAVKILMAEVGDSEISPIELRFFLAGPPGDLEFKLPENPTNWISSNEWPNTYAQIFGMTKISEKLRNFESFFMKNHSLFKPFFESPKNENTPLPEPWESSLTSFQKLIVIKSIRGDKITASVNFFVESKIGKEFTEPPTFELEKSFKDSSSAVPLLFILVTGSDPVNDFKNFAELKNKKYEFVSLGKSMDKIALSKIEEMKAKGSWILLQNCHLAISFMAKLEEVIEQIQINTTIDPGFRLWLTR